jgi:hypothetical protein
MTPEMKPKVILGPYSSLSLSICIYNVKYFKFNSNVNPS